MNEINLFLFLFSVRVNINVAHFPSGLLFPVIFSSCYSNIFELYKPSPVPPSDFVEIFPLLFLLYLINR